MYTEPPFLGKFVLIPEMEVFIYQGYELEEKVAWKDQFIRMYIIPF